MHRHAVYTAWRDPYWVNLIEGSSIPFTSDRERTDAIENGRVLARARRCEHVVLRKDGGTESIERFEHEPRAPRT